MRWAQNHVGGAYHILNLHTKHLLRRHDDIQLEEKYGLYISRIQHMKANNYVLQEKYDSNKWVNLKTNLTTTEKMSRLRRIVGKRKLAEYHKDLFSKDNKT